MWLDVFCVCVMLILKYLFKVIKLWYLCKNENVILFFFFFFEKNVIYVIDLIMWLCYLIYFILFIVFFLDLFMFLVLLIIVFIVSFSFFGGVVSFVCLGIFDCMK